MVRKHASFLLVLALVLLSLLVTASLVVGAASVRQWSPQQLDGSERLDDHSGPSWRGNVRVAMDGQGIVYAFWDDLRHWPQREIFWNVRTESWDTEARFLSGNGVAAGPVAANAGGDLFFTYRGWDGKPRLRIRQANGAWGSSEDIPGGRLPSDIVVTNGGDVHLVFSPDASGTITSSTRLADGDWGAAQTVNPDIAGIPSVSTRLAVDADETLYAVWAYADGVGNEHVYLGRHPVDGTWDTPQRVDSAPGGYGLIGVDIDADATNAHIAWTGRDDSNNCRIVYNQCTRDACASGHTIDSTNGDALYRQPRLVLDNVGGAYILFWRHSTTGGLQKLYLTRRAATGAWHDLLELDSNAGSVSAPAMSRGGGYIAAVWNSWLSDTDGHAIWSHIWHEGFLPGQVPDLTLASEDVQFGQLYEQAGRFLLPLTVTVHNRGTGPAFGVQVRLQHGLPDQAASLVADIPDLDVADESSVAINHDWDITDVMGRLDLIVTIDPGDEIVEQNENNNWVTASTLADASPRLLLIRSSFKPGTFLQGVSLFNTFSVKVDWNGSLSGMGNPGYVTFDLNGDRTQVNPVAGSAEQGYDMSGLSQGSNPLRLSATNSDGLVSQVTIIEMLGLAVPQWLAGNAVVTVEPPEAAFDKVAVYHVGASWPQSSITATVQVPSDGAAVMPDLFGPVLQPWSLHSEFRSDSRLVRLEGQGELLGFLGGRPLVGGGGTGPASASDMDVQGSVDMSTGYSLMLSALTATLQTTGTAQTGRLHLISPDLPILAQSSLALAVDADLGVLEKDNGELGWVTQTLTLDANVEGPLIAGNDGVSHLEGGIGGQPWHELSLSPEGNYSKSYGATLFSWAKERFFVWDKTWEMTSTQTLVDQPVAARAVGPTIALRFFESEEARAPNVLPTDVYAYADPALAYRTDDDMTLVHVRQSGSATLNLSAYRWDGVAWTETDLVTQGGNINAQPAVAYAGQIPIVLWTRVITPVTDLDTDPHAILPRTEIASTLLIEGALSPPVAGFESSSPDVISETTTFTNTTVSGVPPETAYEWDFGDNSVPSALEAPTHLYTAVGTYTVVLTATNVVGSDRVTGTVRITCDPVTDADFAFAPPSPVVSENVTFTGTSSAEPVPAYAWSFGDASPIVAGNPVTHSYDAAGDYTVWMTATNYCDSRAVSQTVAITPSGGTLRISRVAPDGVPASAVSSGKAHAGAQPDDTTQAEEPAQIHHTSRQPAAALVTDGWFTMTLLTNNSVMDFLPAVQANKAGSGDVLAMWLRRDDSENYPLFVDEATRTLTVTVMAARWNGTGWTAPVVALDNITSRQAPQFAYRGNQVVMAWSHDRDANPATITDTEIHVATWLSPTTWMAPTDWGSPTIRTIEDDAGDLADLSPRVVFDSAGQAIVVWLRAIPGGPDRLWYAVYSGSTWTEAQGANFQADGIDGLQLLITPDDNPVALWRGLSESGMDLWCSVLDRDFDLWGEPKQLTHDRTVEGEYGAVVNSAGQSVVIYAGRQIVTDYKTISGELVAYPTLGKRASIFQVESEAATTRDLTVENLIVSPANPSPGSRPIVSGTIVNDGSLTVEGDLVFKDDGNYVSPYYEDVLLAAGDSRTFTFPWDLADTGTAHTLSLIADPDDVISETNEANNVITVTTVLPDLQIAWRTTDYSTTTISVTIGISNGGVIVALAPFDVELRTGSEAGSAYASTQVSADLASGAAVSVTFVLSDVSAIPASATTSFAVVDATAAISEADEGNNSGLVDVPRWPDLSVGPYDITGAPTQRLMVHNRGPIAATLPLVAVYQDAAEGEPMFEARIPILSPGGVAEIPFWGPPGDLALAVRADPDNEIVEGDESNNIAEQTITSWPRVFLPLILKGH